MKDYTKREEITIGKVKEREYSERDIQDEFILS